MKTFLTIIILLLMLLGVWANIKAASDYEKNKKGITELKKIIRKQDDKIWYLEEKTQNLEYKEYKMFLKYKCKTKIYSKGNIKKTLKYFMIKNIPYPVLINIIDSKNKTDITFQFAEAKTARESFIKYLYDTNYTGFTINIIYDDYWDENIGFSFTEEYKDNQATLVFLDMLNMIPEISKEQIKLLKRNMKK